LRKTDMFKHIVRFVTALVLGSTLLRAPGAEALTDHGTRRPRMLKHIARLVLSLAFCLVFGAPANAQPLGYCYECLWRLQEVYSNADGAVQFLLLRDDHDVPRSLAGHKLVAGSGANEKSFTFPSGPDPTGRWILVGTQGFADLHWVNPDFIVPNGFLPLRNGSVRLGPDALWVLLAEYDALPTDGVKGLYLNDGEGDPYLDRAQMINNAGQSYTLTPTEKFTGLWWALPPGSEAGSGIALDHQGESIFAAWATYDVDGSPTWFVMPDAEHCVDLDRCFGYPLNYTGAVYRMMGPPFGADSFDPSAVTATWTGSVTFRFYLDLKDRGLTPPDQGYFLFEEFGGQTDPGRYIGKRITRMIFASPVPVCTEPSAMDEQGPLLNFQGWWWNASESGWGLHLTHQGDIVFATWFTYDRTGKATWLTMTATRAAPGTYSYSGTLYRTTGPAFSAPAFDPAAVTRTPVGTGTLTFTDRDNGSFAYSVDAVSQTKNIARFIFADPRPVCN
jgi:hypothetical protein